MNGTRRLVVEPSTDGSPPLTDLVWQGVDGTSSFSTSLDAGLNALGRVPNRNRDLVWVAAASFLADRTLRRPANWTRLIEVRVPVSDAAVWNPLATDIEQTLATMTSDQWSVDFEQTTVAFDPPSAGPAEDEAVDIACLLSGGADSLCGAITTLANGHHPLLVSHWDWTVHAGVQKQLVRALERTFERSIPHCQIQFGKATHQIGGQAFPNETSRRTRSLLFIALGLAAAAPHDVELLMPENGYASLNPPMTPERMGALSTRTTDPALLRGILATTTAAGVSGRFHNPFESSTKGEMFRRVRDILGTEKAADLLSASHSCSHTRLAGTKYHMDPATHCGACFGCLVRRSAFLAADLPDRTTYVSQELAGPALARFFEEDASDYQAMTHAVDRGLTAEEELELQLRLPDDYETDVAFGLVRRALDELSLVSLP